MLWQWLIAASLMIMNEILSEKKIDESRQGEAYAEQLPLYAANGKKIYLESYGCAMNFSDSEIVASVMLRNGYGTTALAEEADAIFINTCAIRDNAEQRIRTRLAALQPLKDKNPELIVGILGCMAERLKSRLLEEEKIVDIVAGPDAYRSLPELMYKAGEDGKAVNVFLSREETYADITPLRLDTNGVTAFVSIMRGCNNMCSFCVVPYTRGRERSRPVESILAEVADLSARGYREITLLGQNVDSYKYEAPDGSATNFAELLKVVAEVDPLMRVRFSTSHPKDITEEVVLVMKSHANICNYIHLPVQSGSSRVLRLMNRTYDREWYLDRVHMIRSHVPDMGLSTDIIAGFCEETEEEHRETISLMNEVGFDLAYMYMYSERPGTPAARKLQDNVSEEDKNRRLSEIIAVQREWNKKRNEQQLGREVTVLVEGFSRRSEEFLKGRTDQNRMVVFPKENYTKGEYIKVKIESCTSATLLGTPLYKVTGPAIND